MRGSWCCVFIKEIELLFNNFIFGETEEIMGEEFAFYGNHNAQYTWIKNTVKHPFLRSVEVIDWIFSWTLNIPNFESILRSTTYQQTFQLNKCQSCDCIVMSIVNSLHFLLILKRNNNDIPNRITNSYIIMFGSDTVIVSRTKINFWK